MLDELSHLGYIKLYCCVSILVLNSRYLRRSSINQQILGCLKTAHRERRRHFKHFKTTGIEEWRSSSISKVEKSSHHVARGLKLSLFGLPTVLSSFPLHAPLLTVEFPNSSNPGPYIKLPWLPIPIRFNCKSFIPILSLWPIQLSDRRSLRAQGKLFRTGPHRRMLRAPVIIS